MWRQTELTPGLRLGRVAVALVLASLWLLRPLAYGTATAELLAFWSFCGLFVVLPGVLLWRLLGGGGDDLPMLLGQGATVGLAVLGVTWLVARASGLGVLLTLFPLVSLALAWGLRGAARRPAWPALPTPGPWLALLLVATLGAQLCTLYAPRLIEEPIPLDLLFHVGNAAELGHHWPLQDPRVAGTVLNYHLFSAAFPAWASVWTGIPVAAVSLVLTPGPMVVLLVLQVYNTARVLVRDAIAGVLAAAFVVLHTDIGSFLGLPENAFRSYLGSGIYSSPSTLLGLVYALSLFSCLVGWLRSGPGGEGLRTKRGAVAIALLSVAASGAKGSVMPVVILGLATLVAVRLVRRREDVGPAVAVLALVSVASAPVTILLSLGGGSFSDMLRLEPGAALRASPFHHVACTVLGGTTPGPLESCSGLPLLFEIPVALVWLAGYLGIGGLGALLWMRSRKTDRGERLLALGVAGWGLAFACLLNASSGLSQLFFLHSGHVLLIVGASAFVSGALRAPRRIATVTLAVLLLGLFGLPSLRHGFLATLDSFDRDARIAARAPRPLARQYGDGLAWLRTEASPDAVVVTSHGALVISPFAERRSFYETGLFSPRGHALRWEGIIEPYPERVELRERLAGSGDPEALSAIRSRVGEGVEILVVQDRVETPPDVTGWLALGIAEVGIPPISAPGTLVFQNPALRIYRLSPAGASGSSAIH